MKKTTLHVQGIGCGSCVKHVREALAFDGVTEVDVRVREGAVVVEHAPQVTTDRLIALLRAVGYPARLA